MSNHCVAVIPARGGSKRIPKKNIKLLAGRPLIEYTIRAARNVKRIAAVVVSTDDQEIAEISLSLGTDVLYPRPAKLASDTASMTDVLKYIIKKVENGGIPVDTVVLLQPTSPFRTAKHIKDAIDLFFRSNADTVTAVRPVADHPYWQWKVDGDHIVPIYSIDNIIKGRNQLPQYYIENGSIYIVGKSTLFSQGLYGSKIVPYIMGCTESIDIDEPIDFAWAEFLIERDFVTFDWQHD